MVVRCGLKIPSLGITVRHHSASLVTEFSIQTSKPLKIINDSYNLKTANLTVQCQKSNLFTCNCFNYTFI